MSNAEQCPACGRNKGGVMADEFKCGYGKVWAMQCDCGYRYVWADEKAKDVLDAYKDAVTWAYGPKMAKELYR